MAFAAQFATGLLLTLYLAPTVGDACASAALLELSAGGAWLPRSAHRWASGALLAGCLLHVSRVYLTGGFKKPRELAWGSGAALALLALAFGVTGYSLPRDQVGFWALQIVSAVPEAVDGVLPGPGAGTVFPARGGFSVGQGTLSRARAAHTLALPAGAALAGLAHAALIRKQGIPGPL